MNQKDYGHSRYYSEDTDILYRSYRKIWHRNGEFCYDFHTIADNNTYNYETSGNVTTLPEDATPIDVMDTDNGWSIKPSTSNKQTDEHSTY